MLSLFLGAVIGTDCTVSSTADSGIGSVRDCIATASNGSIIFATTCGETHLLESALRPTSGQSFDTSRCSDAPVLDCQTKSDSAITLSDVDNVTVEGFHITNCDNNFAVSFASTTNSVLRNCFFSKTNVLLIAVTSSKDILIDANFLENPDEDGLAIGGSTRVTISNNTITPGEKLFIVRSSTEIYVTKNNITSKNSRDFRPNAPFNQNISPAVLSIDSSNVNGNILSVVVSGTGLDVSTAFTIEFFATPFIGTTAGSFVTGSDQVVTSDATGSLSQLVVSFPLTNLAGPHVSFTLTRNSDNSTLQYSSSFNTMLSTSVSPSASASLSASLSPSASPSVSPSAPASLSASVSPSTSTSVSPSASALLSTSVSPSTSPLPATRCGKLQSRSAEICDKKDDRCAKRDTVCDKGSDSSKCKKLKKKCKKLKKKCKRLEERAEDACSV